MLKYYLIKRTFCFLDEWLSYVTLIYLYGNIETYGYLPFIAGTYICYNAIITSYKNLSYLEKKMGFEEITWEPLRNI